MPSYFLSPFKWALTFHFSFFGAMFALGDDVICPSLFIGPNAEVVLHMTPKGFAANAASIWIANDEYGHRLNHDKFREVLGLQVKAIKLQVNIALRTHKPEQTHQIQNFLAFIDRLANQYQLMVLKGSKTEELYVYATFISVIGSMVIDTLLLNSSDKKLNFVKIEEDYNLLQNRLRENHNRKGRRPQIHPKDQLIAYKIEKDFRFLEGLRQTARALESRLVRYNGAAPTIEQVDAQFGIQSTDNFLPHYIERNIFDHPQEFGVLLYYIPSDNQPMDYVGLVDLLLNRINIAQVNHSPQVGDVPGDLQTSDRFREHDENHFLARHAQHTRTHFGVDSIRHPLTNQGPLQFAKFFMGAVQDIGEQCLASGVFDHRIVFEFTHEVEYVYFFDLLVMATMKKSDGEWILDSSEIRTKVSRILFDSYSNIEELEHKISMLNRSDDDRRSLSSIAKYFRSLFYKDEPVDSQPTNLEQQVEFLTNIILQWRINI